MERRQWQNKKAGRPRTPDNSKREVLIYRRAQPAAQITEHRPTRNTIDHSDATKRGASFSENRQFEREVLIYRKGQAITSITEQPNKTPNPSDNLKEPRSTSNTANYRKHQKQPFRSNPRQLRRCVQIYGGTHAAASITEHQTKTRFHKVGQTRQHRSADLPTKNKQQYHYRTQTIKKQTHNAYQ